MSNKFRKTDPFFEREAQKYVNPIPSREFIIKYLEKIGRPAKRQELIAAFALKDEESQEALRRRLHAMLRDGQLLSNRRGSFALVNQMALVRGHVIGHKEGYGFLSPEDGGDDVFLNARQMRQLFPGDQVLVSLVGRPGKREGVVVEILKRNFTHIVGRFYEENGAAFVVPANKNMTQEIIIPRDKQGQAESEQLVVAEIITYPTQRSSAIGAVVEVLGDRMAPGMEIEVAIRSHGLPYKWSDEVLQESDQIVSTLDAKLDQRQQLQHLPFVTIDGEDAKDFDDAVYCERKAKGGWVLYVAIADVSHYVRHDTAIDSEALLRGNSVYFPNHVIPMLPEILANDLCSLKPQVDRLAMVCEMQISAQGKITRYSFYDAVIRSHARLTYDEVYAVLENQAKKHATFLPLLKELRELFKVFLKQRKVRGALEFDTIETKIVFGEGRKIAQIKPVKRHYVHNIIEECMLAANVCASKFLLAGKIPALYRVHEGPNAEKLTAVRSFLSGLGLKLGGGKEPKSADYAKLLREIVGRPDEHLVQTVLLRSLRQAIYTPENLGHFGLAYPAYAHFTSPIRRYPDLLNHRAIRYLLHGRKVKNYAYSAVMMQNFGEQCSMTERRADEATRDAINWLKCEYMQDKVGKVFDGIISGVTSFGLFVELKSIYVEGLVHVTSLKNDYYVFDNIKHRLYGRRCGKSYRLGDAIKVLVAKVNLDEREIDFELAK